MRSVPRLSRRRPSLACAARGNQRRVKAAATSEATAWRWLG
jgi:hypothetical protein